MGGASAGATGRSILVAIVCAAFVYAVAHQFIVARRRGKDSETTMEAVTPTPAADPAAAPPDPPPAEQTPELPSAEAFETTRTAAVAILPADPPPPPAPPPDPLRPITMHVFWEDTKEDVVGTTITLSAIMSYMPREHEGVTDSRGMVTIGIPYEWPQFVVWNENPVTVPHAGLWNVAQPQPVEIPLVRELTISGIAWIEEENRPAAGARIFQYQGLYEKQSAIADAQGNFRVPRLPPKNVILVATLGPYRSDIGPDWNKPIELAPGMTEYGPHVIMLRRGASVSGVVRDKATGEPIPGAEIHVDVGRSDLVKVVKPLEGGGFVTGHAIGAVELNSHAPDAVTDENGYYQIEGRQSSQSRLTARAEGYALADAIAVAEKEETAVCNFALERGASVMGYVEWQGARRAGADVRIESSLIGSESEGNIEGMIMLQQAESAWRFVPNANQIKTDDLGEYGHRNLAPGNYRAVAAGSSVIEGVSWQISRRFSLTAGEEKFLPLTDTEGYAEIHGRVMAENQSVPGANISVTPNFDWDYTEFQTTTDAEGRYRIAGLRDGEYAIQVGKSLDTGRRLNARVDEAVRSFTERDFDFGDSHVVSAQVKLPPVVSGERLTFGDEANLSRISPDGLEDAGGFIDAYGRGQFENGILRFRGRFFGEYRILFSRMVDGSAPLTPQTHPPHSLDTRYGDQSLGEVDVEVNTLDTGGDPVISF